MKEIELIKGKADVPDNTYIIDLSDGSPTDIGVIIDADGVLEPLAVVYPKSVCHLSPKEADDLVWSAIKDLPQYCEARSQEIPYSQNASEQEEFQRVMSIRLRLYPMEMIQRLKDDNYHLYRNYGNEEKK